MKDTITVTDHLIHTLPILEELLKHVESFNGVKGVKLLNALNKTKEILYIHAEGLSATVCDEAIGLLFSGLEEMTKAQEVEIPPEATLEMLYTSKENPEFFEKITTLITNVYFLQKLLQIEEKSNNNQLKYNHLKK